MGSSRGPRATTAWMQEVEQRREPLPRRARCGFAEHNARKAFLHSHSYTGNPLACAAANATLDIFRDDDVLARNRTLAAHMAQATARLADHPHVAEVRQTGMILAVEMAKDKKSREPYPWQERRGRIVYRHALKRGRCCARSATSSTSCRRT